MLNWAGSLTMSSYLVIGKGCPAKQSSNCFWALKLNCSLGRFSLSAVKNRPLKMQHTLGMFHFECGWDTESAENIHMYLWNQVFSPLKLQRSLGTLQFECRKKTGHSNANHLYTGFGPWFGSDSIYILELGLDSGLIQFIYWIRALLWVWFKVWNIENFKIWKLKNQELAIAISTISMRQNRFFGYGG